MTKMWITTISPQESCIVQELKIQTKGHYIINYTVKHERIKNLKQIVLNHIHQGEFTDLSSLPDDLIMEVLNVGIPFQVGINLFVGISGQFKGISYGSTHTGSWRMWLNKGDIVKLEIDMLHSKYHQKVMTTLDVIKML